MGLIKCLNDVVFSSALHTVSSSHEQRRLTVVTDGVVVVEVVASVICS